MAHLVLLLGRVVRRWAITLTPLLLQATGACGGSGSGTGYSY